MRFHYRKIRLFENLLVLQIVLWIKLTKLVNNFSSKKNYWIFLQMKSFSATSEEFLRATTAPTNKAFNKSRYLIYCSLLEDRFRISILGMQEDLLFVHGTNWITFNYSWVLLCNQFLTKDCLNMSNSPKTSPFQDIYLKFRQNCYMDGKSVTSRMKQLTSSGDKKQKLENDFDFTKAGVSYRFKNIEEINRKLAWIEAAVNHFNIKRACRYGNFSPPQNTKKLIEKSFDRGSAFPSAYESISLVPRSVTRTLSRFRAELTDNSSVLVHNDFDLSKNQALVSLQYVGFFLFLPLTIPISIKFWFLESWIRGWWNINQTQVFINPLQEEKALRQLREVEALRWLDDATKHFVDPPKFRCKCVRDTIQLALMYNELNIQLLLQLITDVISIAISALSFMAGRKRLAVLNSWIQELSYSLNDTMKAFLILLITDLCVGFHSPHGWEIVIGSVSKHFGLVPNKYVISCLVSTFPVVLDTVSKYWIFRHLNRASPSIVATYHTMSG
uniref:Potassium/proton antiporter CemA n=1 Tax=Asplenium prolongatum TaxID=78457 RepID=A0A248R933_9MONI|nr:chloroplast envelope membrane protein [Asplenium prolongatum]ASU93963.1 chloroplast envelope membrane protein [Asplenium prolongatum]